MCVMLYEYSSSPSPYIAVTSLYLIAGRRGERAEFSMVVPIDNEY